ncbi:MAG: lipopolysaccharide biosynthesis protein [Solirubrobacteraceae bacterium]|nr:lipopolysaccharide biosynthesis protein [Solirubrobacteraceae bacterium]
MSRRGPATPASYTHGVAFEVLSFVLILILGVGSGIAIARIYGLQVMGEYALAFAPTMMLGMLSTVREQTGFVRMVATLAPRDPQITGLWAATFLFSTALTCAMAVPVFALTWWIFTGPMDRPELVGNAALVMGMYVLFSNPAFNLDRVFTSFRAGQSLLWIRLFQASLIAAASIGAGLVWGTTLSLLLAETLAWIPALIWRAAIVHRWMPIRVPVSVVRDGLRELPRIVRFGLQLVPGDIAEAGLQQAGTWLVAFVAPIGAVGAYSRAYQLARRLYELRARVAEMLFPTLIERERAGDVAGGERVLMDSVRYVLLALTLVAAAGGGAAGGVMDLFGPGFDQAAPALALLLLIAPVATCSFVQFQALWAAGLAVKTTWISIARTVVGLTAMALLTWQMGITGAALGQLLGYAFGFAVTSVLTVRSLTQPFGALMSVRQVIAVPLGYGAGFVVARAVDEAFGFAAVGVPVALAAGSLAFAAVALAVGGLNDRDRDRVDRLRRKLARAQLEPQGL